MTSNHNLQLAQEYAARLKAKIGDQLLQSIFFGSRTRQDFHAHSDFDFLLIVDHKNNELRDCIIDTEVEMLNQYDLLFASIICEPHEWALEKKSPCR